nr:NAD(P)H-hydrate dehydratase [Gammaproteobacteria bacterium]
HVLVLGGERGYAGAPRMAGEAAARCGAGLVSVALRSTSAGGCWSCPELMCRAVEAPDDLASLIARASVVAVGPGLGQQDWGKAMLGAALAGGRPLVVDADGLNLLATQPLRREDWVLTPHPGEAARLLNSTPDEIQADRFAAVAEMRKRYGGVIVLKGPGTLVLAAEEPVAICRLGNPGMATGGMGDVLCGVIAALLAQGVAAGAAARLGVWLHARAADLAATDGERGLLATDLLPHLRRLVNP